MKNQQPFILIGHRGAKGLAPENTLASISKALTCGVDEIEFDVRVTKDGIPVLSHDTTLHSGEKQLQIAQHTFKTLLSLFPSLATLGAALHHIDTKARPHIEVKPDEPTQPIVDVIEEFLKSGKYSSKDLLLASKSQKTLRQLHKALPDIEKVVIHAWSGVIATHRARALGTKRISMRASWLWSGFIRSMNRRGYQLSAYTLDDPLRAQVWQKSGLYGVITDYPDRFQD